MMAPGGIRPQVHGQPTLHGRDPLSHCCDASQIVLLREGTDSSQGKGQILSNIGAWYATPLPPRRLLCSHSGSAQHGSRGYRAVDPGTPGDGQTDLR